MFHWEGYKPAAWTAMCSTGFRGSVFQILDPHSQDAKHTQLTWAFSYIQIPLGSYHLREEGKRP